jgi:hypothetical protein
MTASFHTDSDRPTTGLDSETVVERAALDDDAWAALVDRLNRQSVDKHHDAYLDVDWDHPDNAVRPDDPRWIKAAEGLVGETDWWGTLDDVQRSRLGLHLIASTMRSGLVFENILTRGLLAHAITLPNGSPEFRYSYHEAIEESQHSLMFQEFVNRSGFDTGRLPLRLRLAAKQVVGFSTRFPELFFVFVLGGEDPIDHTQRESLREGVQHPLLERIMRIHVTEEARHLSFARHQLKRNVGELGRMKLAVLKYTAPLVLSQMADQMLGLPPHIVKEHGIPPEVVRYVRNNPDRAQSVNESLEKVRRLLRDCGLITKGSARLWRRLGLAV